MTVVTGTAS